jgi:choline kinase
MGKYIDIAATVRQAVILAAGDGGRMGPLTSGLPKPLIPVAGRTLIEYPIMHLVGAGVRNIVIVTGYLGDAIEGHLGDGSSLGARITYVWNPDYLEGNALSLACAAPSLDEGPFLLLMSDHLLDADIIRRLAIRSNGSNVLAVDRSRYNQVREDEATKVLVGPDGYIRRLGKSLTEWNALDTGAFLLQSDVLALLRRTQRQEISELIMDVIEDDAGIRALDVSGAFWLDVDTHDDLVEARRLLETDAASFV